MNEYPEWLVERLCIAQHDAYEAAAVSAGWETQQASRKPWADVPEANKQTMRASVRALLDALGFTPYCGSTYWRSNIQWEGAE